MLYKSSIGMFGKALLGNHGCFQHLKQAQRVQVSLIYLDPQNNLYIHTIMILGPFGKAYLRFQIREPA